MSQRKLRDKFYCYITKPTPKVLIKCVVAKNYKEAAKDMGITPNQMRSHGFIKQPDFFKGTNKRAFSPDEWDRQMAKIRRNKK